MAAGCPEPPRRTGAFPCWSSMPSERRLTKASGRDEAINDAAGDP